MFSKPRTTTFVAPAEPIDANDKYLVKLSEIKDEGVSKFADPAEVDPPHNLRWVYRLAHMDRTPVLNVDGDVYEHHDYTSNRTGKSKSKTAKARQWIEALLGRPVEDNEITDELPNMLREKVAVCIFEEVEKEREDGEAYTRLKILRLSPYKAGANGQAVERPQAPPPPVPQQRQPVAAAAGSDIPW